MITKKHKKRMIVFSITTGLAATSLMALIIPVWGTEKIKQRENTAPFISDTQLEKEGHSKSSLQIKNEFSLSMDNIDGSQTLYLFTAPIAYIDTENNLTLIDNGFIPVTDQNLISQGYIYKNSKNSFDLLYPDLLSKDRGILLKSSTASIEITPDAENPIRGKKSENKDAYHYNNDVIQYNNAFGAGTSFDCINTVLGIQGGIVLQKYNGQNCFRFIIKAPGLIPDHSNHLYSLLKNPKLDAIEAAFYLPFVRDSYNGKQDEDNSHFSYNNQMSLETIDQQKGVYSLTLIIDKEFLADKHTKYPITINPSFNIYKKKQPDSSVYSNLNYANQYLSNFSGTGNCPYYGNGRTYARFEYLQNYTLLPDNIESAYYHTFEFTGFSSKAEIGIYNVLKSWCSLGLTWENKSEYGDKVCDLNSIGQNNCDFDITSLVKKWMIYNRDPKNGLDPMKGFLIKDVNENNTWRMFSTADNGYQIPYLEINLLKE